MRERGLCVDHTTIYRWVQRYAPENDKRCRPFLRRTNDSYRIDETYVRVAGAWTYLYRGVDSNGDTLDFLLRADARQEGGHRVLPQDVRRGSYDAPSRGDRGQDTPPTRSRSRPSDTRDSSDRVRIFANASI